MNSRQKLAFILLADAIATELEDTKSSYLKKVVRPGESIFETVEAFLAEHGVNIIPFLSMGLVQKAEDAYNKTPWSKHMSFDELIEKYEDAASRLILNSVGHGQSLEDNQEFNEFKEENNLEDFKWEIFQEKPMDDAYHVIESIYRKETIG